eukprot:TRINITY_DN23107_c0_g1_i3.p1 TRINITY_DN23107_c0_g1~~TRINITY_DN23107_c0_g1_i3.p1  ORF type:complete len:453 (+),score=67.22 TRINITY_DN23107_c0_g1_i3:55-1359(+)
MSQQQLEGNSSRSSLLPMLLKRGRSCGASSGVAPDQVRDGHQQRRSPSRRRLSRKTSVHRQRRCDNPATGTANVAATPTASSLNPGVKGHAGFGVMLREMTSARPGHSKKRRANLVSAILQDDARQADEDSCPMSDERCDWPSSKPPSRLPRGGGGAMKEEGVDVSQELTAIFLRADAGRASPWGTTAARRRGHRVLQSDLLLTENLLITLTADAITQVLRWLLPFDILAMTAAARSFSARTTSMGLALSANAVWKEACQRHWETKDAYYRLTRAREEALQAAHPGSEWKRLFLLVEADGRRAELTAAELCSFHWTPLPSDCAHIVAKDCVSPPPGRFSVRLAQQLHRLPQFVAFADILRCPCAAMFGEFFVVQRSPLWEWLLVGKSCVLVGKRLSIHPGDDVEARFSQEAEAQPLRLAGRPGLSRVPRHVLLV